jgi:hypothetical protein
VYRSPVTSSGRAYDHAGQISWISSSHRDTRPNSCGRGSAERQCACRRLPCFTEFARAERQLVVLPIGLAYATQMLVFTWVRRAGETNRGTETKQPLGSGSAASDPTRPSDSTDDSAPSLPVADTAMVGSIIQGAITPQARPELQTGAPITANVEFRRGRAASFERSKTRPHVSRAGHGERNPRGRRTTFRHRSCDVQQPFAAMRKIALRSRAAFSRCAYQISSQRIFP